MNVRHGNHGPRLARGARRVRAAEGVAGLGNGLLVGVGIEQHDRVDDAPGRRAAEGVGYPSRRHDVGVDAELLRVVALVPDGHVDFLELGRIHR